MVSSERRQHPVLFERKDGTLVTWYCCLYAPRTGGAYDGHHRTAGIVGRTWRRGGVASRGSRAAAEAACDRVPQQRIARSIRTCRFRVPPRPG
jgi:hypothetical protein